MNKSRKVGLCFPFVGDSIGGSVVSTIIVVEELRKMGDMSLSVVLHEEGPLSRWLKRRGVDYQIRNDLPYYSGSESGLEKLVKLYAIKKSIGKFVKGSMIDIVHTNDARIHITWSVGVCGARCRHIWHQRTKWSRSLLGKLLIGRANKVIAISQFVKSGLLKETGIDPIVIANPIRLRPESQCREIAKQRLLLLTKKDSKHTWVIGYVGSFKVQKRPLDFIEIAASCGLGDTVNVRWIMIGKDEDYSRHEIEEIARKKQIAHSLSVYSFQDNIEDWYDAMDILVAPSKEEAFGRNIIEAMNSRATVIAARSGGHKELVRDQVNGFLVDVGNIEGYTSIIRTLIDGKISQGKIRQSASEDLARLYEAKSVVKRLLAVYA